MKNLIKLIYWCRRWQILYFFFFLPWYHTRIFLGQKDTIQGKGSKACQQKKKVPVWTPILDMEGAREKFLKTFHRATKGFMFHLCNRWIEINSIPYKTSSSSLALLKGCVTAATFSLLSLSLPSRSHSLVTTCSLRTASLCVSQGHRCAALLYSTQLRGHYGGALGSPKGNNN